MKNDPSFGDDGPRSAQENQQDNLCASVPSTSTTKNNSSKRPAKRRSRGKVRTSPSRTPWREVAIYDGSDLLGTVKIAADGKSTAYDPRGKRLDLFPTFQAASAAFDRPSVPGAAG
jgi:hypothetical protein